jgi:hypothetical protein
MVKVEHALFFLLTLATGVAPAQMHRDLLSQSSGVAQLPQILRSTFASMGNVDVRSVSLESVEGLGLGIHFSIDWGEPSPACVSELSKIIRGFSGRLKWMIEPEFNNRGVIVSALPFRSIHSENRHAQSSTVSIGDLQEEVSRFSQFAHALIEKSGMRTGATIEQPFEVGDDDDSIYRVLLVADPIHFQGIPTSIYDRALRVVISKADQHILCRYLKTQNTADAGFVDPVLLGICNRYDTVTIIPEEISAVQNRIASESTKASDETLQMTFRKLSWILEHAARDRLGLIMQPRD